MKPPVYVDVTRHETARPVPGLLMRLDAGATSDLDVTTSEMLRQLVVDLADRGTRLALAQARGTLRDRISRTGPVDEIGEDRIHLSMAEAVAVEGARFPSAAASSSEPSTLLGL